MNVQLTELQPSDRLKDLVGKIEGLYIVNNEVTVAQPGEPIGWGIYNCRTNSITSYGNRTNTMTYVTNPLLNKKKLTNPNVKFVSEANFCDLLLEHLYLSAKLKLEELLPQIQALEPSAKLNINDPEGYMIIYVKGVTVVSSDKEQDYQLIATNHVPDIWEDKDELVVKKPEPKEWWLEPTDHYVIYINLKKNKFDVCFGYNDIRSERYGLVNKTIFETEEEAQLMVDKLNKAMEE